MIDAGYVYDSFFKILKYAPVTLRITLFAVLVGLLIGLSLTVLQLSGSRVAVKLAELYIALMRGSPMLVLMLLTFYGLPVLFRAFHAELAIKDPEFYAVIALSFNIGAYFSEAMRSAYLAVDRAQLEAGISMGIATPTIVRRIILPQAAVLALPNIKNSIVAVLKNSALVYAIGITDIYQGGRILSSATMGLKQLEVFITVTLLYWVFCILIEAAFGYAEKKASFFM